MSNGKDFLHNHSALERELRFPKHVVLVDEKYREMFDSEFTEDFPFVLENKTINYLKVRVLDFVRKGGVFKNLMR